MKSIAAELLNDIAAEQYSCYTEVQNHAEEAGGTLHNESEECYSYEYKDGSWLIIDEENSTIEHV